MLSSCLNSDSDNIIDNTVSPDPQLSSIKISSSEDAFNILSKVKFSIDQVSSVPLIFNKDSLPYLFDVSKVHIQVETKSASGIKLHLYSPDSTYIWDRNDSVEINRLKYIEVFAQNGVNKKRYMFQLNTHQQDPDTIFWQNVDENYIHQPTDQVTLSNENEFFNYYKSNNSIKLVTSPIGEGNKWINQQINGLPSNVLLKSIQNNIFKENRIWYALDETDNVYESANGKDWNIRPTDHTVKSILGILPSFSTKDLILTIVKDGGTYKFAKTDDFSSFQVLNNMPEGFPIKDYTSTIFNDSLNHTAKYLIATGGKTINETSNQNVWILQGNEAEVRYTSILRTFNVTGSTLFNYDNKIYLLTSLRNKNVFYTSSNYGAFWKLASDKQSLPKDFTHRKNHSVIVDKKNNIWIFGGHTDNAVQLAEVWKGHINKLFVK